MPKYTTKKAAAAKRRQKTVTKSISRDKRVLKHWAASGTERDFQRLRAAATKFKDKAPDYVLPGVMEQLETINRRRLVEAIHADGNTSNDNNFFTNALAWLSHIMPTKGWSWATDLTKNSMMGHKGDAMTEQDEDYAKLIDATYRDDRPEYMEHWQRLVQYDSNYLSVWQNRDGHVYIACRGTKMDLRDLIEDMEIMFTGDVAVDEISEELQRILKDVSPDVIVDAGAHSLGTTLLLKAYDSTPSIKNRIRRTFLYNPAASAISDAEGVGNVTEKFEKDNTMRYFVNLSDPISVGMLGTDGPVNAVFRTGNPLQPMTNHGIASWYPGTYDQLHKIQMDLENTDANPFTGVPGQLATSAVDPSGARFTINFGEDDWLNDFETGIGGIGAEFVEPFNVPPVTRPARKAGPGQMGTQNPGFIHHMETGDL